MVAREQGRARRGALSHAALAISALDQEDAEAAAQIGIQVVDLASSVSSSRCIEAVRDLQRRLSGHATLSEVERFNARARYALGLAA